MISLKGYRIKIILLALFCFSNAMAEETVVPNEIPVDYTKYVPDIRLGARVKFNKGEHKGRRARIISIDSSDRVFLMWLDHKNDGSLYMNPDALVRVATISNQNRFVRRRGEPHTQISPLSPLQKLPIFPVGSQVYYNGDQPQRVIRVPSYDRYELQRDGSPTYVVSSSQISKNSAPPVEVNGPHRRDLARKLKALTDGCHIGDP